jgi:hypothetical protein
MKQKIPLIDEDGNIVLDFDEEFDPECIISNVLLFS